MRALIAALLVAVAATAHAQPRSFQQAELDALLAPIALYPDPLLSQVLIAATYPEDVREAAAWSRANAHLKGDEAVRAAHPMPWDASLKALLAHPELLARMDESPQWTEDLGEAFLAQEPQVMETVQALRRRAQASGFLQSDGYQSVQQHEGYVVVQPVYPDVVYLPWYNPLVVYGPWWWHTHHPIAWRPWPPAPVTYVSYHYHYRPAVDWHRRHVHRPQGHKPHNRIGHVHKHPVHRPPVHRPAPVHRPQVRRAEPIQRPPHIHNHVHQATTARPIVEGARLGNRTVWGEQAQRALQRQAPAVREPRARSGHHGGSGQGRSQGRLGH